MRVMTWRALSMMTLQALSINPYRQALQQPGPLRGAVAALVRLPPVL
jgi:hypothetical protein